jgi:hypothetical protein
MIDIACTCEDLPAHSHIYQQVVPKQDYRGRVFVPEDTGEIRIWVDWKAVARELARP